MAAYACMAAYAGSAARRLRRTIARSWARHPARIGLGSRAAISIIARGGGPAPRDRPVPLPPLDGDLDADAYLHHNARQEVAMSLHRTFPRDAGRARPGRFLHSGAQR